MSSQQARKFLEGWVLHLNAVTKEWVRYWLVLRGSVLFLFVDDHTIPANLAGTFLIRPGVAIHNLPSKKRFKFLLVTTSRSGHQQENVFRFDLETEFNLWKCFLLGISQRRVPDVISLAKDQLEALKMAIHNVASSADTTFGSDLFSSLSDESRGNSLRAVISQSPLNTVAATRRSSAAVEATYCDESENDALSRGIADLDQRRIEVSRRALTAAVTDLKLGSGMGSLAYRVCESSDSDGFSMHSSVSSRNSSIEFSGGSTSSATFSYRMSDSVMRMPFAMASAPSHSDVDNNNKEFWNHKFHVDAMKNKEVPSWFVSCSREEAIHALTVNHHYGNVLMRPSSKSGKYVITLCRKITGKSDISHYSVVRTTSGYKIDVRNEHQPLACLCDVMEFFVSVAGTSTKPLSTNDVNLLTQMANDTTSDTSFSSTRTCTNSSTDTSHVIDTAAMKEEFDVSSLVAGTVASNFDVHPSSSLPSTSSYAHDSDYATIESFESQSVSSTMSVQTCRSSTEADVFGNHQPNDEGYQNLASTSARVSRLTSLDRVPPPPPPASSKPRPAATSKPPAPPPASSKPRLPASATSKPPTPPPASSKPRMPMHVDLSSVDSSRSDLQASPTPPGWHVGVSSLNDNDSLESKRLAPPTAPRKRSTISTAVDMCS